MEFHISRAVREAAQVDDVLFSYTGNVVFANVAASRKLADALNKARDPQADPAGGFRIPIADVAHAEEALRELRTAGAAVASLEVAEPELEEVFVKIMRREEKVL